MAAIYLSHPTHGAKVAIDEMEAAVDVANGWSRGEQPAAVEVVAAPEPALFDAPAENQLARRRPGRPRKEA